MGKKLMIALGIITIIVGLFGMAYWGSHLIENQKEIDRLKARAQQEERELEKLKQEYRDLTGQEPK
jgi:cell division protein FtsL